MGATWMSWRITLTVIVTGLQIRAINSVKTTAVTGEEGQTFYFRCEYPRTWVNNSKYLCRVSDDDGDSGLLIWTNKHKKWEVDGRFSLYDNATEAVFIMKVDKLTLEDRGTYWCVVDVNHKPDHISIIQLNVFQGNVKHEFPPVDKLHMPLFLTALMCVAAILFVCLFTVCLLHTVKHQRVGQRRNREASSDYETMMPGVRNEAELRCNPSPPDCGDLAALPPPPPDLCSHFSSKQRESTVTLGVSEYVDVESLAQICQYQHLDLSQLENHVYHSFHGNRSDENGPKDELLGIKEKINC